MRKDKAPLTALFMEHSTRYAHERAEAVKQFAHNLTADPSVEKRLQLSLCKSCFYSPPRVGGAAITQRPCMCCTEDQTYAGTNTDVLCLSCAVANALCKRCGGDIETDINRTKWPTRIEES